LENYLNYHDYLFDNQKGENQGQFSVNNLKRFAKAYNQLKKSIIDDEKVFIGKVKYIDYKTGFIDQQNVFSAFMHKRKSFEHEKEIRAIVSKYPPGGLEDPPKETILDGIPIKVNIELLIQKIHVAPNAPTWFSDLVKGAVKRYGCDFEVIHSQMDSSPLF